MAHDKRKSLQQGPKLLKTFYQYFIELTSVQAQTSLNSNYLFPNTGCRPTT